MCVAEWHVATRAMLGLIFPVRPGQQCELRDVNDENILPRARVESLEYSVTVALSE